MDRNEYYAIYFKDKLVAVITEKELADLKEEQRNSFNKDIKIKRIADNEIDKFLIKDVRKILTKEERKKLEEDLFIKEIVESIKGQLMSKPDMDIVIPEKAYNFIPQIYYTTIYSFWKIKNNIFLIFVKYCLTLFYFCSIIKLYKTKGA